MHHQKRLFVLVTSITTLTACGGDAPGSGKDDAGADRGGVQGQVLAANLMQPQFLTLDGTHAYWVAWPGNDKYSAAVMKVALTGGTPQSLATGQEVSGNNIAVNESHVYWTESGDFAGKHARVMRVPLGGGDAEAVVSEQENTSYVAVNATHIYWGNAGRSNQESGELMRMPLAGGPPETVASGLYLPGNMVMDNTHLYFTHGWYEFNQRKGSIRRVPLMAKDGQPPVEVLVSDLVFPANLRLVSGQLYFTDSSDPYSMPPNQILRVPVTGGKATPVVSKIYSVDGFALDSTHIYWTLDKHVMSNYGGKVMRAKLSGGPPETLVEGLFFYYPGNIQLDRDHVYWATTNGGGPDEDKCAVMKLAK